MQVGEPSCVQNHRLLERVYWPLLTNGSKKRPRRARTATDEDAREQAFAEKRNKLREDREAKRVRRTETARIRKLNWTAERREADLARLRD